MDCEHYNYDPAEHDYCPDCGLQDSELLHVEKEVVELREENERLKADAERLKKVIRAVIFHLELDNALDIPHDGMIAGLRAELERGE